MRTFKLSSAVAFLWTLLRLALLVALMDLIKPLFYLFGTLILLAIARLTTICLVVVMVPARSSQQPTGTPNPARITGRISR
jgi:hypothetical protein